MAATKLFNPLDDFQSYSVHYVMLAARTTEEAKVFIDQDPSVNSATLAAIEQVKQLGEAITYNNVSNVAYLVMDTRRFSQFTIDRLKYEVLINGLEKGDSHGNLATMVEMNIVDSVGISFINFLQWLMDSKMQCNFDGMIFMLRLIFVGHKPDGTTETVQTVTIPMHLSKLELNLDYAKGAYTAEFMPNINFDTTANYRWLQIGTATTYVSSDNTLGAVVDNFQKQLNDKSAEYFARATSAIKTARKETGQYGRQVKYMITLPEKWRKMKFNGVATSSATETDHKKKEPGKPQSTNLAVDTGLKITDVLDKMFKQTPEISDLGNGRKSTDSVGFYKHLVGITSSDAEVIVHIDVIEFKVPNVRIEELASRSNATADANNFYQTDPRTNTRVPKNFMEFDYIFTGKNTSILNFDMKLQDLQWMLASNLEIGHGTMNTVTGEGQDDKKKTVNSSAELVLAKPYDALLMPLNTEAELNNFNDYASLVLGDKTIGDQIKTGRQDYTRNLSAFYAGSPITVVMTIKGNPLIMTKFNMGSFLEHAKDITQFTGYRDKLEKEIIRDNTQDVNGQKLETLKVENGVLVVNSLGDTNYTAAPVFVKVNIMGPNVNHTTGELINGEDFARAILYDNYYVVFKVTNLIEGSNFTQELELWSHNVFGNGKMTGPPDKTVKAVK